MADTVRTPSRVDLDFARSEGWTWALDGDDSGRMIEFHNFSDKCVHIYSVTAGSSFNTASITLYGSNDPRAIVDRDAGTLFASATASWVALTDPQGNAITKTAAAIEQLLENPLYILPVVTLGNNPSTSEIRVTIVGRKTS